jgi:hypothetical protein
MRNFPSLLLLCCLVLLSGERVVEDTFQAQKLVGGLCMQRESMSNPCPQLSEAPGECSVEYEWYRNLGGAPSGLDPIIAYENGWPDDGDDPCTAGDILNCNIATAWRTGWTNCGNPPIGP